jgi:hypothetical protein
MFNRISSIFNNVKSSVVDYRNSHRTTKVHHSHLTNSSLKRTQMIAFPSI